MMTSLVESPRWRLMMNNDGGTDAKIIDLTRLKFWFGAPPLHVGESEKAFDHYVNEVAKCMEPEDGVYEVLVYRFAAESWKQMQLIRYQAQAVRRRDNARYAVDAQHALKAEKRKIEESDPASLQDLKKESDPEYTFEYLSGVPMDNFESAEASLNEVERAEAFEKSLEVYEKIDRLISESGKRINDILRQIEWYRISLAERLRTKHQVNVEMLSNELGKNPSLVPVADANQ